MKEFFKKFGPSVLSVATIAVGFLAPSVQAYVAAHPTAATTVIPIWAIINHLLPSPTAK